MFANFLPLAMQCVRAVLQVRFVVMSNMFNTDLQIHKRFDLKVGMQLCLKLLYSTVLQSLSGKVNKASRLRPLLETSVQCR